ncbi:MAG: ATP-binding cassette domain-containing protein [Propionibacteriaceae bacterium]|nr:ATP-binding cassette domain-containing protein [Propionibacteriaceae bacterium]
MPLSSAPEEHHGPCLEVVSAGHRFAGGPWLFRQVQHSFTPEAMTAIIGPSGSGKSTLLAALGATLTLAEGHIHRHRIKRVARVAQTAYGVPTRSVRDHLTLPLLITGTSRTDADLAVEPLAAQFGIDHLLAADYRHLSGGEAQRLMLARAVATRADLILADEPTASLDATNTHTVVQVLTQLTTSGAIVIIATHDPLVMGACSQILDLADADRSANTCD